MSRTDYTFYGSLMSYYSGKSRSYLRKKRLPFVEKLPNDPHYLANIAPKVGGAYQPTIVTPDGNVLRDTSVIIDTLEARHPDNPVYPLGPKQRVVALLFELFGDESLLKAAMHYRWIDPDNPAGWAAPKDDNSYIARWFVRFADPRLDQSAHDQAQVRMNRIINITLPGLGITTETVGAIEDSFKEFLRLFEDHLGHYPYLLGGAPSIGDFGLMGPLYAHLGRDPIPSTLIKNSAPAVFDWVERMNAPEDGLAMYPNATPEFLENDDVPETLLPIIALMARDFMPEVASVIAFLTNWLEDNGPIPPGTPVLDHRIVALGTLDPIGHHEVPFRGKTLNLAVRHYMQWMFQRVQDTYLGLGRDDRKAVDDLLAPTGILPYLELPISRRIERVDDVEVFA